MSESDVWLFDGALEPIDFDSFAEDRFPAELAERVIETFSRPGEWVLDPFAGLGTTLFAADRLGRPAIGIEPDPSRAAFIKSRLQPPSRLLTTRIESVDLAALPPAALVFTSPPYVTVDLADDPWGPTYFEDMAAIFAALGRSMAPGGTIVVEVSNVRTGDGFRALAGQFAACLRTVLRQTGEIARINTGPTQAGPGTQHSSLLIFSPTAERP
jgi:hypothetical protein